MLDLLPGQVTFMSVIYGGDRRQLRGERARVAGQRSGRGPAARSPRRYAALKAAADWVMALVLLVLAAPVILVTVILVRLTSRGPAFYSQMRLGLNGRPYRIHKIRTMYHDCERLTGPRWATPRDPRITPLGRFLRLTHIDELPQLWNVLRGEMSLIGPRPERPEIAVSLDRAIPHYRGRLLVRPGLSGLAQVQLPPDTDLAGVRLKLAYDLYYVHYVGFWLDLRLLIATALHVLRAPFAVSRALLRVPSGEVVEGPYRSVLELGAAAPANGAREDRGPAPGASDLSGMQEEELEALATERGYHPAANELLLRQYALQLKVP
jgi:lipopolysaccharide/colanic/teichoic acid biosynthesis glycosyltransferase